MEKQVLLLFAGTNGFLDAIEVSEVARYEQELHRFAETRHPGVLQGIAEKKTLDDALKAQVVGMLEEFGRQFAATAAAA